MSQTKPKPIDPMDAALDVRAGKTAMADLPPETQQAIRRLNRFNEGKLASHAARLREERSSRAFMPGPRTRRAVLS